MKAALDKFTLAYLTAAMWTADDEAPGGMDYRDTGRAGDLIAKIYPPNLEDAVKDCAEFQSANAALLAQAGNEEQNGHDFWLTRNGHGAGFWDRGYADEIGDGLTAAAKKFGEKNASIETDAVYIE